MNPLWTLLPPLLVIPFIIGFGEARRNLREGSILVAGVVLFLMNVVLWRSTLAGVSQSSGELPILSNFSLQLVVEPMGVVFGLLASFLWVVTTVYSIGYMRGHDEKNQTRFYTCFAIAIAAVMAAAYAGNLLTLFVAYEVITLSTFPLVTHAGHAGAVRAGKIYIGILMSSSIALFLPAMIWVATQAGTLDFMAGGILHDTGISRFSLAVLMGLFVFGIGKAAVMPLHRWLPAAMVAPTPVSALLHAVAVVKTGVFSLLKIVTYTFGIDTVAASGAADWILPFTAFTVIVASVVAFTKDNLKARLAYSTISQLSYIVMAALLATTMSVSGGVMHIVMHAFGKITLFFCAGAILVGAHKDSVSQLDGLGKRMPLTMAAFAIGALGIIGLPPTGGTWSKLLIAGGSLDTGTWFYIGVLMLSTLLNIAYLLPIPLRAFFKPLPQAAQAQSDPYHDAAHAHLDDHEHSSDAPAACRYAIAVTATVTVLLFFFPGPLTDLVALIPWR